jgi:glycosyltransferase involved in cell wall biosynthesis
MHPAPWQRVLLEEFKSVPDLKLHVISVRNAFARSGTVELEGVTFHCLKVPRGMRTLSLFWWETMLIRRCLSRVRPHLVHAWGTERGAALVASRLKYPHLVTMQGLLAWCLEHVDLGWFVRLEARLEAISLRRASVVTAESSFAVNWLKARHPHLKVSQVEHAPSRLFHQVERRVASGPPQLLYVGSMCLLKGSDLLLQALDQLAPELDFRLTIVGPAPAPFLERMKLLTSSALWQRIHFRHSLTQPEVADELARATLFLFPTRVDNSPNSVKEAVVAGVPVVGSAVGGMLDYIRPGLNGLTFEAEDLQAFVQAIRSALAHPLFSRGQVEPATLAQMRAYLSTHTMGQKFLAAYNSVEPKAALARGREGNP